MTEEPQKPDPDIAHLYRIISDLQCEVGFLLGCMNSLKYMDGDKIFESVEHSLAEYREIEERRPSM